MRRILLFVILVLSIVGTNGQLRLQQLIVKTRGRLMNDGSIRAGELLDNVIVSVKDGNSWVSDHNGQILFALNDDKFAIEKIEKTGYVLTDQDVVNRYISYTADTPFYIIFEKPAERIEQEIALEIKVRRVLMRNIRAKETELDSLRRTFAITEREYQTRLKSLCENEEQSTRLVKQFVQECVSIDFDTASDFDREFSRLLLSGELDKADSLLLLRGNIEKDIVSLTKLREANCRMKIDLSRSEAYERYNRNNIAQYCLNRHKICVRCNKLDSAVYYIKKRAQCDTTNVAWLYDAASFIAVSINQLSEAKVLYETALRQAERQYGEHDSCVIKIRYDINKLYR